MTPFESPKTSGQIEKKLKILEKANKRLSQENKELKIITKLQGKILHHLGVINT